MAGHPDGAWQWPPWPSFDPDARCPKCGYDTITTTYYAAEHYGRFLSVINPPEPLLTPLPERLRRGCVRCGHWWCESVEGAVNDQAPTGPALASTVRSMAEEAATSP